MQLSRVKGSRLPDGAVNVARPGRYGNPFKVDGPWITWAAIGLGLRADKAGRTEAAVRFYRAWMTDSLVAQDNADEPDGGTIEFAGGDTVTLDDHVRGIALGVTSLYPPPRLPDRPDLAPLRGKDLACWCPLDGPCHADVLLELANAGGTPPTSAHETETDELPQ